MSEMQWDLWSGLRIRLKSSAGSQLGIWQPSLGIAPMLIDPTYIPEVRERKTFHGARRDRLVGYRAQLVLHMKCLDGKFAGSFLTQDLETVLGTKAQYDGSYIEVALHTTDYKRCEWDGPWDPQPLAGKDVGLQVRLVFSGADLQDTIYTRDNGSTW